MQINRPIRILALALTAAATLNGCEAFSHVEGGNQSSDDLMTYVSTSYQPKTVTLLDTRDGEELWSVEVPVGKKLVVKFYKDKARKGTPENPDLMKWQIGEAKDNHLGLRNSIPVPPADARRLDMSLRATPEWPQANAQD